MQSGLCRCRCAVGGGARRICSILIDQLVQSISRTIVSELIEFGERLENPGTNTVPILLIDSQPEKARPTGNNCVGLRVDLRERRFRLVQRGFYFRLWLGRATIGVWDRVGFLLSCLILCRSGSIFVIVNATAMKRVSRVCWLKGSGLLVFRKRFVRVLGMIGQHAYRLMHVGERYVLVEYLWITSNLAGFCELDAPFGKVCGVCRVCIYRRIRVDFDRAYLHNHGRREIEVVRIIRHDLFADPDDVSNVLRLYCGSEQYSVFAEKVLLYEIGVLAARKLLHERLSQLEGLRGILRFVSGIPGGVRICLFLSLILYDCFATNCLSRGEGHEQRQRKREGCHHC